MRRLSPRLVLLIATATLAAGACSGSASTSASSKPPASPTSAVNAGQLFVQALGETRYVSAEAYLAPAFRTTLPEATLKAKWEVLAHQDGKFKGIGEVAATAAPGGAGSDVTVPVTFAGGSELVHVTVDSTFAVTAVDVPTGSGHNPALDASPGSGSPGASPTSP
jgi:hypothetical protein